VKMSHVGLSVADIDRSIAFYRDMFGMEQACEVFPFGGPQFASVLGLSCASGRMCMITGGDVALELFEFAQPEPGKQDPNHPVADHGSSHFGFEVDDIEAVHPRLAAAGVAFHAPVTTFAGGMKATYGRDPDGNVFEIMERGPPPPAG
jgi:catechol 2,3-dioxygenase-like lactoylglutathione lyase family enzyme